MEDISNWAQVMRDSTANHTHLVEWHTSPHHLQLSSLHYGGEPWHVPLGEGTSQEVSTDMATVLLCQDKHQK